MTATHVHLLLNHIPVLLVPLAAVLLGVSAYKASRDIQRVALALFVLAGLIAGPVYLSGEPAEHAIEPLAVAPEALVEQHEEAAQVSLIVTEFLAAIALGALIMGWKRTLPRGVAYGLMVGALGVSLSLAYTANLGGQIRHSEIRAGAPAVVPQTEDD